MEPITVKYKVLDARAKVPAYATPGAAAADLCAVLDAPLTVAPMQRVLVPTGLAIELPGAHSVALVYARSGLSIKHGLCMANGVGVVDSDYRGELKVPMVNLGAEAYTIQPGERVAQLCIAPVYTAAFVPAEELGDTQRGVGGEAKAVIGRTPGSIVAVRPLKDGVIADFDITANMLENFLKKACGNSMFSRPRVVICIPSGVTEVERRAVREATLKAGARQVSVIEEPMAAAIGAGLPISEPTGSMIVDIGGGTAEIAVISLGGIVASRSVRMAGDMFDQAIIAFIKRKYNLLIGERTAEQIKIEIGSAYVLDPELTMEIKGRNLVDGLPKNIVVHSEDVRGALLECLVKITTAIKETLERTPPELSADIIDRGITLTGGGALLRGLDQLIQSETGIDVHIAEDPLDCVAKGAGAVLDHVDVLHDVLDTDGGHM